MTETVEQRPAAALDSQTLPVLPQVHRPRSVLLAGRCEPNHPDNLDARLLQVAGVCILVVMVANLDANVVGVAQRTFVAEFASTQAVVSWTMTGYTLALATVIPLAGWAADRFSAKRLFMGSVLAFTVGSLLCAVAPNIMLLIAFRVMQGLGGGMLFPVARTILTREAGSKRIGRVMAVVGIPMLLAPLAGPILGGWLLDTFSWPWIFAINLPIGATAFVLAAIVFPTERTTPSQTFDVIGLLLLSPGLASFLYGMSSIPSRGTVADLHVWIPAAIGLALIGGFVFHARYRVDHPLIDLRLFNNREVTAANATILLLMVAYFGVVLLLPSCLQQLLHQTPLQSGIYLAPTTLGAMLTMPIAGVLLDKHGPRKVVLTGITLIGAGIGTFACGVATQASYLPLLLAGLVSIGMGLGCTLTSLPTAAVRTLAPHQIARGSALIYVNMQVAASISIALMSVILTSQFNRSANNGAANKTATLQSQTTLSHAYTTVYVVAVVLLVLAYIPATFLPRKQVTTASGQSPPPIPQPASVVGCHDAQVNLGTVHADTKLRPTVLAQIPHDRSAFTEGLELDGTNLYEGIGWVGQSQLRELDPATGALRRAARLPHEYFGEGIAVVGDRIWQLTYHNGVAIEWDKATLTIIREVPLGGQGWGLCSDGHQLVQSDGTYWLRFRSATDFAETGSVAVVTRDGEPVCGLNGLAWVDGQVWANIFPTDQIARIDPATGLVTAVVDATGLLSGPRTRNQVLNGIAHVGNQIFLLTAKNWPTMFRVRFDPAPG